METKDGQLQRGETREEGAGQKVQGHAAFYKREWPSGTFQQSTRTAPDVRTARVIIRSFIVVADGAHSFFGVCLMFWDTIVSVLV